jgi:DNA-binding HxlR family transcriptional regulator
LRNQQRSARHGDVLHEHDELHLVRHRIADHQNLCSIGLRALKENGFVFRHYQAVIAPAVTYGIADRMKDIEKVLAQLEHLSRKWKTQGREGTQASRTGSSSLP